MPRIRSSVKLEDDALLKLPTELNKALRKALRAAGKLVVKRAKGLVPPPGYPGDKPEFKPLRDTLGVEVKEGTVTFAVVGPKRPAGAHGHLVEYSHRHFARGAPTGVMTEAQPFMGPAAKETEGAQKKLIQQALTEAERNA